MRVRPDNASTAQVRVAGGAVVAVAVTRAAATALLNVVVDARHGRRLTRHEYRLLGVIVGCYQQVLVHLLYSLYVYLHTIYTYAYVIKSTDNKNKTCLRHVHLLH